MSSDDFYKNSISFHKCVAPEINTFVWFELPKSGHFPERFCGANEKGENSRDWHDNTLHTHKETHTHPTLKYIQFAWQCFDGLPRQYQKSKVQKEKNHAKETQHIWFFFPGKAFNSSFAYCRDGCWNARLAHDMQMVPKLFLLFSDTEITSSRVNRICAVLSYLLQCHFSIKDIIWYLLSLLSCSVSIGRNYIDKKVEGTIQTTWWGLMGSIPLYTSPPSS